MSSFFSVTCAPQTSAYQCFKLEVLSIVDLSKDAVHIYIGMAVFLLAAALWQRGRIVPACLLPVLIVASTMEALDLIDDWRHFGTLRFGASAHDIINTMLWPSLIVILHRLGRLK